MTHWFYIYTFTYLTYTHIYTTNESERITNNVHNFCLILKDNCTNTSYSDSIWSIPVSLCLVSRSYLGSSLRMIKDDADWQLKLLDVLSMPALLLPNQLETRSCWIQLGIRRFGIMWTAYYIYGSIAILMCSGACKIQICIWKFALRADLQQRVLSVEIDRPCLCAIISDALFGFFFNHRCLSVQQKRKLT